MTFKGLPKYPSPPIAQRRHQPLQHHSCLWIGCHLEFVPFEFRHDVVEKVLPIYPHLISAQSSFSIKMDLTFSFLPDRRDSLPISDLFLNVSEISL